MARLRILVIDGNTEATNRAHVAAGGRPTGDHYADVLRGLRPDLDCTILHPADGGRVPDGLSLADYDGAAWTGSALNIYQGGQAVETQIALSRAAFQAGLPQFGSCWGLQVGVTAAGGRVERNPKGRELGIARRIVLSDAGRAHPMYEGKAPVFDAIAVHLDEVAALPPGARILASNGMSIVQAAEFRHESGLFWGVQYHPEYDFNEIAAVIGRYGTRLVDEGFFADIPARERLVADFRRLHADPDRRDIAWLYGLDGEVTDPRRRRLELDRWLSRIVAPRAAERGRG